MISDERAWELWLASLRKSHDGTVYAFARAVEEEAISLERERFAAWLETLAGEVRALKEKP